MALLTELRARFRHRGDSLTCQATVELVTDYLEGALDVDQHRRFERHLRTCPDCLAYVEQTRQAAETLGRVEPEPPTGHTRAALLDAFRDFHRDDA